MPNMDIGRVLSSFYCRMLFFLNIVFVLSLPGLACIQNFYNLSHILTTSSVNNLPFREHSLLAFFPFWLFILLWCRWTSRSVRGLSCVMKIHGWQLIFERLRLIATGEVATVASDFFRPAAKWRWTEKRTTSFSGGGEARTADLATMRRALCPLHQMPFGPKRNLLGKILLLFSPPSATQQGQALGHKHKTTIKTRR